jgi:hypothetical protein
MIKLFILAVLDSSLVIGHWEFKVIHSMHIIMDGVTQVKIDITTSKEMCHHSRTRRTGSHVVN